MQYTLPLASFDRLALVHQRLLTAFGPLPEFRRLDPVSQMILAILSARTRDEAALRVFAGLVRHFDVAEQRGWTKLAEATFHEIDPLLEDVTHPERKAVALPRALREVIGLRGALTLDFLAAWPVEPALAWLERLYGVGPKTSTATLNLSTLRKRVLVVDTAHWRAARCLGLIPARTGLERATRLLNRQAPDTWSAADMEEHHGLMQRLGRVFCAKNRSAPCPFQAVCGQTGTKGASLAAPHRRDQRLEAWLRGQRSRGETDRKRRPCRGIKPLEDFSQFRQHGVAIAAGPISAPAAPS